MYSTIVAIENEQITENSLNKNTKCLLINFKNFPIILNTREEVLVYENELNIALTV